MVDIGELEIYLNDKSAKENDIVEITGEGKFEEKVDDKGNKKKLINLPIKLNGRDLIYSPGKKAIEVLRTAWSRDTKNWIGKKFTVKFVVMQIGTNELNVIKPVPLKI